jgi:hypothetical protein
MVITSNSIKSINPAILRKPSALHVIHQQILHHWNKFRSVVIILWGSIEATIPIGNKARCEMKPKRWEVYIFIRHLIQRRCSRIFFDRVFLRSLATSSFITTNTSTGLVGTSLAECISVHQNGPHSLSGLVPDADSTCKNRHIKQTV